MDLNYIVVMLACEHSKHCLIVSFKRANFMFVNSTSIKKLIK